MKRLNQKAKPSSVSSYWHGSLHEITSSILKYFRHTLEKTHVSNNLRDNNIELEVCQILSFKLLFTAARQIKRCVGKSFKNYHCLSLLKSNFSSSQHPTLTNIIVKMLMSVRCLSKMVSLCNCLWWYLYNRAAVPFKTTAI